MLIGNSLHVLCFGDSLTHGMTQHGTVYHPYALALQSTLQNAFPWLHVTVDERGQDGDLVASPVGHFLPRMETLCELTLTLVYMFSHVFLALHYLVSYTSPF